MKYLQAVVLLCGVALALGYPQPEDKPETKPETKPEVKPETKPKDSAVALPENPVNCDCQCDYYTWSSKGKIMGNCNR
jgi:hypothetical protein